MNPPISSLEQVIEKIREFRQQETEAGTDRTAFDSTLYELEKSELEKRRLETEIRSLDEEIRNKAQDRVLRGQYADKIFFYLFGYSMFGMLILLLDGFPGTHFHLADSVLITLVGGTAVSVIGLVGWVARGLFRAPKE